VTTAPDIVRERPGGSRGGQPDYKKGYQSLSHAVIVTGSNPSGYRPLGRKSVGQRARRCDGCAGKNRDKGSPSHSTFSTRIRGSTIPQAATLVRDGSPPVTTNHLSDVPPTDRAGARGRLLPRSCSLPQMAGGSASAFSLSRPARASHALQPAESLSSPRLPLSQGSDPSSYPAEPPASFRTYRQFSGWNSPPQVFRAFGAYCH
jgi:hypothetical protein